MIKTLKETVCKSNSSQLGCYPAVVIPQNCTHTCFTILAVHLYPTSSIRDFVPESRVHYHPHVEAQSPQLTKPGWNSQFLHPAYGWRFSSNNHKLQMRSHRRDHTVFSTDDSKNCKTVILSEPFFLLTSLAQVYHEELYIWNSLSFIAVRLIQMFLQETLISITKHQQLTSVPLLLILLPPVHRSLEIQILVCGVNQS